MFCAKGRDGGEYYTPRPLIKTIVKVVAPTIGNKIYDGAVGSAGFNERDLKEFVELQKTKADSDNSWSINIDDVDTNTYDLSVKNPHKKDETVLRSPKEIIEEMKVLDKESAELLKTIEGLL